MCLYDKKAQISFFEENDTSEKDIVHSKTLTVVKSDFIQAEKLTINNLFSGYNELRVITFSSGIDFMSKIVDMFEYVEVIFGNPLVVNKDLEKIAISQNKELIYLAKHRSAKYLSEMVEQGKLKLFIARNDYTSHEKIYLLKSNDERFRVITGSANFSQTAFGGKQREIIEYYDSEEAYAYFYKLFEDYKDSCTDSADLRFQEKVKKISVLHTGELVSTEDLLENAPVFDTLKEGHIIEVSSHSDADDIDVTIAYDVEKANEELKKLFNSDKDIKKYLKEKENSRIYCYDDVKKIQLSKKKLENIRKEKKLQTMVNPKLHIDYENEQVFLNGAILNLNPEPENIKKDLLLFTDYIDSCQEAICGNTKSAQRTFFLLANWLFASPFFPFLRYAEYSSGSDILMAFPTFAVLRSGNSNGGKSSYVKLLYKMMSGLKSDPYLSSDEITQTKVNALRATCEGLPLCYDDISQRRFTDHMVEIAKMDTFGMREKMLNYPSIVMTTNKVNSVNDFTQKRMYICEVDINFDNNKQYEKQNYVAKIRNEISNSFYREYLKRMIPVVKDIEMNIMASNYDYEPDIFQKSCNVICSIYHDFVGLQFPEYMSECVIYDYMGSEVFAKRSIHKIIKIWETSPLSFSLNNQKVNVTLVDEDNYNRELKCIAQELPPKLDASVINKTLSMNEEEATKLFKISFRREILSLWFQDIIDSYPRAIKKKRNNLLVDFAKTKLDKKTIRAFKRELPRNLNPCVKGSLLILNYKESIAFFKDCSI